MTTFEPWAGTYETTAGTFCSACHKSIPRGCMHVCNPTLTIPAPQGWLCPRCGASNAPFVLRCSCPTPTVGGTGTAGMVPK